jgi:curved DNA-binding protein CbpA
MSGVGEIADGVLAADDGAVRAALGQELIRLQGTAGPAAALGIPEDASAEDVRARFLAVVKLYHPNRFARRPADVIRLANEVFLLLRRAYERLAEPTPGASSNAAPAGATAGAAPATAASANVTGQVPAMTTRASEISPPSQPRLDVDAALAARRRRPRSQPSMPASGIPTSQAIEVLGRARRRDTEQKERFLNALADLEQGRLPSARTALRSLVAESPSDRRFRAYLHCVTGRMHESAGRVAEAVVEYDRALGFDPDLELARGSRDLLTNKPSRGEPEGGGGAGRIGRWFRK